tara:strand:- start:1624 stop:1863 length:240 start_codon:yes stop_codon:yes gene_type:complete
MAKNNSVNHPSHYTYGKVECLDAIKSSLSHDEFCGFLKAQCIKYLWRYKHKNGIEDLRKCDFYMQRLICEEVGNAKRSR